MYSLEIIRELSEKLSAVEQERNYKQKKLVETLELLEDRIEKSEITQTQLEEAKDKIQQERVINEINESKLKRNIENLEDEKEELLEKLNLIMGIDININFKNVEVLMFFKYYSKNLILYATTTILLWYKIAIIQNTGIINLLILK